MCFREGNELFAWVLRSPLVVVLIVSTVVVRLAAWWWTAPAHPINDMAGYLWLGQRLLDTGEFGGVFRPPGYPLFLAGLQWVTGGASLHVEGAPISIRVGLAHAALGGLTTWLILRALPAASTSTRRIAGTLAAFYPPLVLYATTVLSEVLAVCIVSAGVYGLVRDRASRRWVWGGGLMFGLACLVRESLLSLSVCLAILLAFTRGWRFAAWFALGLFVAIVPWTLRNVMVQDTPVVISTSVGHNLLIGNNPFADGSIGPGRRILTSSESPLTPGLSDYEEHVVGTRYAVSWALAHPAAFLTKGFRGGLHMFGLDRQVFHDIQTGYFDRHFGRGAKLALALLVLPGWPLLLIAIGFGFFVAPREVRLAGAITLLWMFAIGFVAFGEWRFRTSGLALLFPLAAYGAHAVFALQVTRRQTAMVAGGVFALSLFWAWEVMSRADAMLG